MIRFTVFALCLAAPGFVLSQDAAPAPEAPPANPAAPKRGMESGAWTLENWGNRGAVEHLSAGERRLLKLSFTGGDKEKTAFRHFTGLSAAPDGKVRLHLYAPADQPPKVSLAFQTGPRLTWTECAPQQLAKGWNALELPLAAPHWKTEATKWQLETGVEPVADLRAFYILVFNEKESGWLLVEGAAVDPDETGRKVATLVEELQAAEAEKRAKAEEALALIGRPAVEALLQAKVSPRPEVQLRAEWALARIQQTAEAAKADERTYAEAMRRYETLRASLQEQRQKLTELAAAAKNEVAKGRAEVQKLAKISDQEKQALNEALDKLEKIANAIAELAPPPPVEKPAPPK
jgi:hypothetical protein